MKKLCVKNTVLLSFFLLMILGCAGQRAGFYQSKKYTGLTPADSASYLNVMQYDEKSKFMYLISNDASKVYIDIILSDRAAIQKTMMYGLTTWIDPEGKKKKSLGIGFPVPGGPGDMGPGANHGGGKDKKGMRDLVIKEKNSRMLLEGFSGKGSEVEINPQSDPDFSGKLEGLEGGKIRVFLAIPIAQLGKNGEGAFSTPISIGFETGYMDLNKSGMAPGPSSSGGDDHHHDGPGGGPPGGGGQDRTGTSQQQPQQDQPDLDELARPSKMWIKQVMLTK